MPRHAPPSASRTGLALTLAALALACQPIGPVPGGRLHGEVVTEPVSDWSFARDHATIAVETRIERPHSVTVWCTVWQGRLYVPSRDPETKRWVRHVTADPRVRVKIGERIYPATAVAVEDPQERTAVLESLLAKYELERPALGEEPDVLVLRIEWRAPAPQVSGLRDDAAASVSASTWRSG